MNIGTVVEGPIDRLVLEAILNHLIPGEHNYLPFQPIGSPNFGDTGAGWKGVRRWCRQTWQRKGYSLEKIFNSDPNYPLDILVIHIDADIADEHDLQEGNDEIIKDMPLEKCPPIGPTIEQLRRIIKYWLKCDEYPRQVVLAIPAQDTENWIFAALFPDDNLCVRDDYECIKTDNKKPAYLLSLKEYGKLTQRKNREIKKSVARYRKMTDKITDKWHTVCHICSQADNFDKAIIRIKSSLMQG